MTPHTFWLLTGAAFLGSSASLTILFAFTTALDLYKSYQYKKTWKKK